MASIWVSDEKLKERLDECRKCEHMTQRVGFEVCKLCGCFLRMKAKVGIFECPIGKWKSVTG